MATIQQLTFVGPGKLEWQEVAAPRIERDVEAIVEPVAVARCDLDLYIAMGVYPAKPPFALGHEMTAVVREVGTGVKQVKSGDHVIVPFQIHCGNCANCKRGWTNACTAVPPFSAFGLGTNRERDFGGAFSDLVRIPFADAMLVPLPKDLSAEAACGLGDNVADGYRTVAPHLARFPGEPVLVVGGLAQSVGLYATLAALALGSREVTYTDFDDNRLSLARAAGAEALKTDYANTKRAARRSLIAVDASGTPEGLAFAMRSTAPCGFLTGVSGGLTAKTAVPLAAAYQWGLNYDVSRVHGRTVLPKVLALVTEGKLDPLSVLTRKATFSEAIDALVDPTPKVIFTRD
ncbi:MAG: alcohol dehydrogenase catalytic domain-containing protein [Myxococcota bacterium]